MSLGPAALALRCLRRQPSGRLLPVQKARPVDPVIEVYKRGIDRTLILRNLDLTPEERLLQLMELQKVAEELRRAGGATRRGR